MKKYLIALENELGTTKYVASETRNVKKIMVAYPSAMRCTIYDRCHLLAFGERINNRISVSRIR